MTMVWERIFNIFTQCLKNIASRIYKVFLDFQPVLKRQQVYICFCFSFFERNISFICLHRAVKEKMVFVFYFVLSTLCAYSSSTVFCLHCVHIRLLLCSAYIVCIFVFYCVLPTLCAYSSSIVFCLHCVHIRSSTVFYLHCVHIRLLLCSTYIVCIFVFYCVLPILCAYSIFYCVLPTLCAYSIFSRYICPSQFFEGDYTCPKFSYGLSIFPWCRCLLWIME